MRYSNARIVFVSGLSGSGKSTAMAALEDLSFYCVDNLPVKLIEQFVHLCTQATPPIEKIALAVNAREEPLLRELPAVIAELRRSGAETEVIFLDCSDAVLVNRYRETRRVHPLSRSGSVEEGIERERRLLVEVAALADYQIDTSTLNVHQLKANVVQHIAGEIRPTVVNLISFGFRYGTPAAAEQLFDVRFLPNPYFEERLRERSGREPEVADYVLKNPLGAALFERLRDLCNFLVPLYDEEGKAYVTIGVGCTGGRHRSVAVVEALAESIRGSGREVNVEHRDMERSG
ncbi:MAG TPA: RNase adapter RapZ [Myxococcota bacterium]|nr:RNase adapter RapZ [Myxococcota bacterium]